MIYFSMFIFEIILVSEMIQNCELQGVRTVERAVINKDKGKYNLLVEGLVFRTLELDLLLQSAE